MIPGGVEPPVDSGVRRRGLPIVSLTALATTPFGSTGQWFVIRREAGPFHVPPTPFEATRVTSTGALTRGDGLGGRAPAALAAAFTVTGLGEGERGQTDHTEDESLHEDSLFEVHIIVLAGGIPSRRRGLCDADWGAVSICVDAPSPGLSCDLGRCVYGPVGGIESLRTGARTGTIRPGVATAEDLGGVVNARIGCAMGRTG